MKKYFVLTFLIFYILGILAVSTSAQSKTEISVSVVLDRDTIGLDEQAILLVEISGASQNLPKPQLPTLSTFEVYSQGRSSNISIMNGVVSSTVSYRYLLLPKKAGTFPIQQIAVVANNKRYKGNSVELTVLNKGSSVSTKLSERAQSGQGKTKDYFFEAIVDKKNPYVNEQVTLTLKFYIAVQYYGSPELTEPTTTGFWTEILGNKAPYYQKINNRNYKVIERKYALFPTQTGELTIGRAMIQVTVASKRRSRNPSIFGNVFGRGEDVSVRTGTVKLNIKALPRAKRPDDFTGTIGDFKITATANKREVEVNQPVSVSIKISGTGNIKSIGQPIIPEMAEQFRIMHASSSENISKVNDKIGGAKIYEEIFIPKRLGEMEIPALTFNYFDPARHQYKTISTKPIKIKSTKPEGYAVSSDVPYASPDITIGSNARDIRYIKDNPGDLTPIGHIIIFNPLYLIANGLPVLFLAGMILVRFRREKLAGDIGYARSKAAAREAKRKLARAKSIAKVESVNDFYLEIYTALTSYIADKMNISPHGLTTESVKQMLTDRDADESIIDKLIQSMQKCDFARFASSAISQQDIDKALVEAEEVMILIDGVKFE